MYAARMSHGSSNYRSISADRASDFSSKHANHWRRQGGPRGPRGPRPPNRRAKIFLVKTERLSSLPPAKSGRACYDNLTGRGHFYQMPNMYICIAYLIEVRKFCWKNLVRKGVNFEAQNALKLTYEHL